MQDHFTPVIVNLDEKEMTEKVLHMVAVREEDVAVDAGWRLLENHRRETSLHRGVRVLAPEEAGNP